jgi:trimethylamine---corrinoid protein Co-methyltransferase
LIDAQIGHEKTLTGVLPALAGSNIIYGMGMIDMGMTMSYEQILIDADIVKKIKRISQGIIVDEESLALDVIEAVGPAGNYLAQRHTLKHMKKELSVGGLMDRRMREAWESDGAKDIATRANEAAKAILKTHIPEPLTEDVSKKIREIILEAEKEL